MNTNKYRNTARINTLLRGIPHVKPTEMTMESDRNHELIPKRLIGVVWTRDVHQQTKERPCVTRGDPTQLPPHMLEPDFVPLSLAPPSFLNGTPWAFQLFLT